MNEAHESSIAARFACPGCGGTAGVRFASLGDQPLANNLVPADRRGEREPRFPLDVEFCDECKLVKLTVTVPPTEMFSEYLYFSSFSKTVVDNGRDIATRVVRDRGLGSDSCAMEIGSNDGYLLAVYKEHGVPVLGIDPAANIAAVANDRGIETINAFFGLEVARSIRDSGRRASVIHANNVIAHVPAVNDVMAGIAHVLRPDGVAVIETPYVRDMIDKLEFDTIYHEHLFYYSLTSISNLLARNGLKVIDVERIPIHGGTIRVFAALDGVASSAVGEMLAAEADMGLNSADFYLGWQQRIEGLLAEMRRLVNELVDGGASVAGYGAAAKATVMLNAMGEAGTRLRWIADRNPDKQNKFMPGVGVPVVPVERILDEQPDYLVIHVWNILPELMVQLADYRARGGKFIVPVPWPTIV